MKMKKLVSLITITVLTVICMTACTDEPTKEVTGENGEVITEYGGNFGLNETAVFEKIKITATELKESEGVEYFEAEEGNVFVGVKFEIENISDDDQNISSMLMFSAYLNDVACEYTISAGMAFDESGNTLDGTVAPGKKMIGYYAVEAPQDWNNLEIHVQPDVLDETKASFVFTK